ncbi:MAG: hypothetical protein EAY75_11415 [Bacteroidetes bacterium]|nr:MAG: hypothetical protein EAY75_11415 [Bacteroidota bacterium]
MLAGKLNLVFGAVTLCIVLPLMLGLKLPQGFDLAFLLVSLTLTGIPHGAIDHVIYESKLQQKLRPKQLFIRFFLPYIAILSLTFLLWIILPEVAFWLFLLISAYHFGQSQLYHIQLPESHPIKWIIYTAWGGIVLAWLWLLNWDAQVPMFQSLFNWDFSKGGVVFSAVRFSLAVCLGVVLVLFCFLGVRKLAERALLLQEAAVLVLLYFLIREASMYLAFAIYFGLWHALRVIITEYQYLKLQNQLPVSVFSFIKAFLPFSFISFAGIGLLLWVSQLLASYVSPFMLFLIFISALTTPHALVMRQMYGLLSKKKAVV